MCSLFQIRISANVDLIYVLNINLAFSDKDYKPWVPSHHPCSQITVGLNLVPRAFLRRGEDGREKTLASADHVTNLNITFPINLC